MCTFHSYLHASVYNIRLHVYIYFMLSIIAFVDNGSVESLWDVKTKRELEEFCEDEGWAVVDVKKTGTKSNSKNET